MINHFQCFISVGCCLHEVGLEIKPAFDGIWFTGYDGFPHKFKGTLMINEARDHTGLDPVKGVVVIPWNIIIGCFHADFTNGQKTPGLVKIVEQGVGNGHGPPYLGGVLIVGSAPARVNHGSWSRGCNLPGYSDNILSRNAAFFFRPFRSVLLDMQEKFIKSVGPNRAAAFSLKEFFLNNDVTEGQEKGHVRPGFDLIPFISQGRCFGKPGVQDNYFASVFAGFKKIHCIRSDNCFKRVSPGYNYVLAVINVRVGNLTDCIQISPVFAQQTQGFMGGDVEGTKYFREPGYKLGLHV